MKLLVTGGAGFIGSSFIRYLYAHYPSYRIINYDALTYAGNLENLRDVEVADAASGARRYRFLHGDICDGRAVDTVLAEERPDVLVNFAAESHVDRSLVDSGEFVRTNVLGVQILLDLVRAHQMDFLQISTDEIYGDVPEGTSDEESPIRPSNPYAASKAAADVLVQAYVRSHKVPASIIRGSNAFGPYQYPEKLIPLAITNLLSGVPVPVHGTGQHARAWLHVDDFVSGVDRVLHKAPRGSIYNIAGHEARNLDVLRRVAEHLGVPLAQAFEHVGDRPGADFRYAPGVEKIARELGWRPARHLHEALPEVIAWYRGNMAWWKALKARRDFLDHYERQAGYGKQSQGS